MTIDSDRTRAFVQRAWDDDIVPTLTEYIKIPKRIVELVMLPREEVARRVETGRGLLSQG